GGLAHAGLADQYGIVLGAALQDLYGAADLVVTADDRIQLALAGALGQVGGVLVQGFPIALAFGIGHIGPASHRVDGRLQRLALQAAVTQCAAGLALVVGKRQQEEFAGDIG